MAKQRIALPGSPGDINRFVGTILQGAANGDKVSLLSSTSFSPTNRVGMRIHQINYHAIGGFRQCDDTTDLLEWGFMTTYNDGSVPSSAQIMGVIDYNSLSGAPTSSTTRIQSPLVKEFGSWKPVCHPSSLYAWLTSTGFTAAVLMLFEIYYEWIELDDDTYDDLLRQMLSSNVL